MLKWLKALQIGLQLLTAVQNFVEGTPAVFSFTQKGKLYTVTLTQMPGQAL